MSEMHVTETYPNVTSQHDVCPIPFKIDPYFGCPYQCAYCFAKSTIAFNRNISRRKKGLPDLTGLSHLDVEKFRRWVARSYEVPYNYKNPHLVAFKERIPIKVGGNCDPFPPAESRLGITKQVLEILHERDYPTQILTKNPRLLYEVSKGFDNPNWAVSVSLISLNEEFLRRVEINTPSAKERLKYIEALATQGRPVLVKVQPAIYPYILNDLDTLVPAIKNSGAWGFNIEGLKTKPTDSFYKEMQLERHYIRISGVDTELKLRCKLEYLRKAKELADTHGLSLFVADNYVPDLPKYSCGAECCGTEKLRNYKIFARNEKTLQFGGCTNASLEFEKCKVNHTYSRFKYKHLSFEELDDKKTEGSFGL